MRIRKRFPLSSLSSPPLSDPQLNRSPVVQQPLLAATTCSQPSDSPNQTPPPPSDQNPMIESAKDLEDEEGKEKSNFTRKARMLGAKAAYGLLHNQEVGRWCEGDKVVPPKKRGDFGTIMKREKKMKSKTNKIYAKPNEEQGSTANEEGDNGNNSGGKKVKRGNVILEGSRCSRVNGRGWRCCQQTLVGYSLCEYHLGKGRLGSINASVRYRAVATTTANAPKKDGKEQLSSPTSSEKLGQGLEGEEEDDLEDDCKKKPLMVIAKKRMKLGMVKARSLSSLLSQTNSEVVVADNDKNMSSV